MSERVLDEGIDRRAGNPGPVRSGPFVEGVNEVLDIHEAAELLHIAPSTLKRHARAGTVPARKLGARWVFSRARLVAFVDSGQAPKGRDEADQMPRPTLRRARESIAVNLEARRKAA